MSSTTRLHVLAVGLHHRQLVILKKKYCKHPTELQDSAHCTVYTVLSRENQFVSDFLTPSARLREASEVVLEILSL